MSRRSRSEKATNAAVATTKRVESALIIGLIPTFARPKIRNGSVAEAASAVKKVTMSSSQESVNAIRPPAAIAGRR